MSEKDIERIAQKFMDADNDIYKEMNIEKVTSFEAPAFAARAADKAVRIIRSQNYDIKDLEAAADMLDAENFHRMARAVRFVIAENVPYDFI